MEVLFHQGSVLILATLKKCIKVYISAADMFSFRRRLVLGMFSPLCAAPCTVGWEALSGFITVKETPLTAGKWPGCSQCSKCHSVLGFPSGTGKFSLD